MSSYQKSNRNVEDPKPSTTGSACYTNSSSEYKTSNKSGLTPIRPTKSPATNTKLKSGLTPTRPGFDRSLGKSPNPGNKQKLKSGLTPTRPGFGNVGKSPFPGEKQKLKSGLQPIKPGTVLFITVFLLLILFKLTLYK